MFMADVWDYATAGFAASRALVDGAKAFIGNAADREQWRGMESEGTHRSTVCIAIN